jgi:hypothetical protein
MRVMRVMMRAVSEMSDANQSSWWRVCAVCGCASLLPSPPDDDSFVRSYVRTYVVGVCSRQINGRRSDCFSSLLVSRSERPFGIKRDRKEGGTGSQTRLWRKAVTISRLFQKYPPPIHGTYSFRRSPQKSR